MPLNISLDQFSKISDGKYNAGQVGVEVKKDGSVALKKVNAHVHLTSLNTATIDPAQTLEIKEAFVKALAPHIQEATQMDAVREELGLPTIEGGTVSKGRAFEPLTRQEVRDILDKYMPPEARKARAAEATSRVSIREKVNQENLAAQPIRVGGQALDVSTIGTDKIAVEGLGLSPQDATYNFVIEDAKTGLQKTVDSLVSDLRRADNGKIDLTTLVRKLNTISEYANIAAEYSHRPGDTGKFVNAALARALDRLDNATLAAVYQGTMSRELDGLKTELSRRMGNPAVMPSQLEACESLFEGLSRLEARVVSEVSYRVGIAKTPDQDRANFQSPVQRWCGDDAAPTAHDGANDMTVTNLEILATRTNDALQHSDASVKGADARLKSYGLTKTDTRKIGDMIRGTELTLNVHLGSLVGWHGTLREPGLADPGFSLRNTFASKEAQGLELDGTGYLVKRDEVEKYFFPEYGNVPLTGRERPLYAAFNPAKTASGGIGSSGAYGSTVVVLKPHVKQQATYTLNDTFVALKLSTTPESRQAFVAGLTEALRGKVSEETIRELSTPGTELCSALDDFYGAQGGTPIDASKTEKTICLRLADLLADRYNENASPLDFNHVHSIMIRSTAIGGGAASMTATFDNIEDLLATADDFQAVGFGVSTLRRNDPRGKDAPFRLIGCDYIEAQLHGPIVLGRDVEEIRISEKEIYEQAEAEFKALENKPEDKDAWIAERVQMHKDAIAGMARESDVKISFHEGMDENGVIAGDNYMKDLQSTRRLMRDANLGIAEEIVANEMPMMRQRSYAGLDGTEKTTLAKAFGADLAQMPDWLKDKIGTVARQQVLASIRDIRGGGESAVEGASIRAFIIEKSRNVMETAASVLAALDRYGVADQALRDDIAREFVQNGWPRDNADSFVATKVAIDRVTSSPEAFIASAMTTGFPESIRTELSALGAKDGLPLARKGLLNLAGSVVKFLSSKLPAGRGTDVDKLIAEARDQVVIPALKKRIELLLPISSLEFKSEDDRKAFTEWAVNSGRLKTPEEVEGVYVASGNLVDSLAAALKAGPIDGDKMVGIYKQFIDIVTRYGAKDAHNHFEFGTDDRNTIVDRPVSVAMSLLFLRVGQEGMSKLGEALSSRSVGMLYAAASSAYGATSALEVNDDSAPTPFTMLIAFLGRMGARLNEKYGQHCPIDSARNDLDPISFTELPPAQRKQLSEIAPAQIEELSKRFPFKPTFRAMPAVANPDGLPRDLAGRKRFLLAALPSYRQHEQTFEKGRNTHGRTHATRAFVFANVLGNIIAERGVPVDMNALSLGIAGHDMGRQGPGEDKWERESGDLTTAMGENLTGGAGGAAWCDAVKANIAGHAPELAEQRTIEGYLLKAADSFDYTRVDTIKPSHLHFMDQTFSLGETVVTSDFNLRKQLIKEAAELTRLTDPYTKRRDELNQLMKDGKMEEYQSLKTRLEQEEIAQTADLSDEQVVALVENTIRDNPDKFPLLSHYYR